jgi:predicted  nucleic acid-binding Zn-ribbon protein
MNEELKNKKEEYKALRDEYSALITQLKDNVKRKKALRIEIVDMRKKFKAENDAKLKA